MSRPAAPEQPDHGRDGADRDSGVTTDGGASAAHSQRQSVSELARAYGDSLTATDSQKRDRSESGDSAPANKRGARERSGEPALISPTAPGNRRIKDQLDSAIDALESRMTASLSRDFHELRETLKAEIDKLSDRVKDLEKHVEDRDNTIAELSEDLTQSRREVSALQSRVEDAEINSRLPCLILSGPAMAGRRAPRLEPPLPGPAAPGAVDQSQPADPGRGQVTVTSQPAGRPAGVGGGTSGQSARAAGGGGASRAGGGGWEQEDVNELVVSTLNRCMPGLGLSESDIDRAHRLPSRQPGANHRVIVRFVRSGQGSVRDQIMSRRLELRGRDLFVNESLTRLRNLIFRSLLAAKREGKVYTVYSRGGQVYYKEQQHGVSTRVDSLQRLRDLGFTVSER